MNFDGERLNMACGMKPEEDYINHDIYYHSDFVDCAWDMNVFPYPWKDNTFIEIKLWDIIEHLDDPMRVIEECWRILKSDGLLTLRTNTNQNETAWKDVTHKRVFERTSFDIFDSDIEKEFRFYIRSGADFEMIRRKVDSRGAMYVIMKKK